MRPPTSLRENRVYSQKNFLITSAKRLLQQNRHERETPMFISNAEGHADIKNAMRLTRLRSWHRCRDYTPSDARPMAVHAAGRPAASSLTASVVSGLPLTADANATSNTAILCKLQSPRGAKKDRLLIVRSLAVQSASPIAAR